MRKISILLVTMLISILTVVSAQNFDYDQNAELDYSFTNTNKFGYRIIMIRNYPFIYFRDKDNPRGNIAQYNWKFQYWLYKKPGFNASQVDLKVFFKKIDLSKTVLQRDRPKPNNNVTTTDVENKKYNYSKDPYFRNFMAYLKKTRTNQKTIDFFLKAANNPAKRGRSVKFTYGTPYGVNQTGIQAETMKSMKYKGVMDGHKLRQTPLIISGGMQYYFELHEQKYVRSVDTAINIFKAHKVVPLTIVELEPKEGNTGPRILRGRTLVNRARRDLKKYFHKDFNIKLITMKVPYNEFADSKGIATLTHFDSLMEKYVHPKIDKDCLVIYYFTDRNRLYKIDDELNHPLRRGPYGTDWARKYHSIIHEFGHSLGMRHHFNERSGSADINTHICPACVMNYKYSSREFCPLCRYALGIED